MADGILIDPGTTTPVATDDLSGDGTVGGHVQLVKLLDGTDGGNGRAKVGSRGLEVDRKGAMSKIQVASAGLTTAATAYAAGDQLGAELAFANAARAAGAGGAIVGGVLLDKANVVGPVDLFLFDRSVTPAADNAAAAFSDADMMFCLGYLEFAYPRPVTNSRVGVAVNVPQIIVPNATTIYGHLVTRASHTFFGAATDLVVTLFVDPD